MLPIALCDYCGRDMASFVSCTVPILSIQEGCWETEYVRVIFGQEKAHGETNFISCPDCAAPLGGIHHYDCDWEQCPRCGKQLLGCDCEVLPMRKAVPEAEARFQMVLDFE